MDTPSHRRTLHSDAHADSSIATHNIKSEIKKRYKRVRSATISGLYYAVVEKKFPDRLLKQVLHLVWKHLNRRNRKRNRTQFMLVAHK